MRKKRSDRNYLLYQIICVPTGEEYFGLTVMKRGNETKTLDTRLKQHFWKARAKNYDWTLPSRIRQHGEAEFAIHPIGRLRGKAEAYKAEAELINKYKPTLNTKCRL